MSLPPKRCGRPPVLSFLEKKKRKQSLDRRRGKTRIYVGNHIDRWLTLKEKLDFRNDAEVAGFLLDFKPACSVTGCLNCIQHSRVGQENSQYFACILVT
uniref:ZN692 protein n=1 Tax=Strigops habroptila TaxID=2489341 RepID=A0A672UL05_STRHB